MWNEIVLTEAESRVLTALRFLDPNIERLAATTNSGTYYSGPSRGGFKVKLKSLDNPIPIGSLGDGTWRMLAMAISLIRARDGILLVDEIDTGLHYSVLEDMWRLIYGASKEFNIQIFATTHSFDCVQSLASISRPREALHDVTVQRIEMGNSKAIPFSEAEIKVASERNLELR